ncbi:MAG: hypothetical protein M3067_02205 [Chloroflexota bacterium]|nr:hypothetical protein [Chloroflexota bacterium]
MPFLLAAVVLAAGFLGHGLTGLGGRAPISAISVVPVAAEPAPVAPSVEAVPGPPRVMECGRMPAFDCSAAVLAAREALGGTDVSIDSAQAWPALVCGDDLDCPRALLARSDPVGSVMLMLADGRGRVLVNVERVPAPTGLNETGERLIAQVIRWFHGGYLEPMPLLPG